eukprot:s2268_g2.t1
MESRFETPGFIQEPPFVHVRLNTTGALQPLTLSTAKNLGVLKQDGVPFMVAHALPPEAPASTRRLLRRWLLAPRSKESVNAMRQMLRAFSSDQALVLPSLHRVPPVAKVIAYITARTGTERLFRDVMDCVTGLKTLLENQRYEDLWNPLLKIVACETGLEDLARDEFVADLDDILHLLQKWLHDTSQSDDPLADCHVSEDVETQRAVERLFESNEAFRGVASQRQELVADAYQSLKSARQELCAALREGLPPDHPGVLVYNPFDNDICFKKKPLVDSHGAHDRRGKVKKERFTTKRLETNHSLTSLKFMICIVFCELQPSFQGENWDGAMVPRFRRFMAFTAAWGTIFGIFFGVAALMAYFIDVEPVVTEMSEGNPGDDFSVVPGGCNITSHRFIQKKYCTSSCTKPRSKIEKCQFWVEYTGIRLDSGDSFFDQFLTLGGVSCNTVPSLPATPEIGEATPCWKTNLNSTPGVYQCACTAYFASCSTHAGNCTKITDPAILWQRAQRENGDSMVYVWCFFGASILCLLPSLSFILWRCLGRSKGTEIVPEEQA